MKSDATERVQRDTADNVHSEGLNFSCSTLQKTWAGQQMAEWRERGFVPDSDDESDEDIGLRDSENVQGHRSQLAPERSASIDGRLDANPTQSTTVQRTGLEVSGSQESFQEISIPELNQKLPEASFENEVAPNLAHPAVKGDALPLLESLLLAPSSSSAAGRHQAELNYGLGTVSQALGPQNTSGPVLVAEDDVSSSPLSSIGSFSEVEFPTEDRTTTPKDAPQRTPFDPLEEGYAEIEAPKGRRELRQRNPIQLHPYALENAIYQQTLKSRGVQPVRTVNVSQQHGGVTQSESQDQDVFQSSISVDSEMPESASPLKETQDISQSPIGARRVRVSDIDLDDEELPDISTILQSTNFPSTHRRKRQKIGPKISPERPQTMPAPQFHVYDLPTDDEEALARDSLNNAAFSRPPSPPQSNGDNSGPDHLIPHNGSDLLLGSMGPPPTAKNPAVARKRVSIEISSSTESSEISDQEPESRPTLVGNLRRKIRGVLPASWLQLDLKQQNGTQAPATPFHHTSKFVEGKGVARRVERRDEGFERGPNRVLEIDSSSDESTADRELRIERLPGTSVRDFQLEEEWGDRWGDEAIEDDNINRMLPTERRPSQHARSKRKRQKRLDETRIVEKRPARLRSSEIGEGVDESRQTHRNRVTHEKRKTKRQRTANDLPQLSILDAPGLTLLPKSNRPQFLNIAGRNARRQTRSVFQNPEAKHFKLASASETREINQTLANWRAKRLQRSPQAPRSTGLPEQSSVPSWNGSKHPSLSPPQQVQISNTGSDDILNTLKTSTEATLSKVLQRRRNLSSVIPTRQVATYQSHQLDASVSRVREIFSPLALHGTKSRKLHRPRSKMTDAPALPKVLALPDLRQEQQTPHADLKEPQLSFGRPVFPKSNRPPALTERAKTIHNLPIRHVPRKQPPNRRVQVEEPKSNRYSIDRDSCNQLQNKREQQILEYAIKNAHDLVRMNPATTYHETTLIGQGLLAETLTEMLNEPRDLSCPIEEEILIMNPKTDDEFSWCGWTHSTAQELESIFSGLQHELSELLLAPPLAILLSETQSGLRLTKCQTCLEQLIMYVNQTLFFGKKSELELFISTSLRSVESLLELITSTKPTLGGPGIFSTLQVLNRVVVFAFQSVRISVNYEVADHLQVRAWALFETVAKRCMLLACRPAGVERMVETLNANLLETNELDMAIRTECPEIDAVVTIRYLSAGVSVEPWTGVFNRLLTPAIQSYFTDYPPEDLAYVVSVVRCICPVLEITVRGDLARWRSPSTLYEGWSYVVPVVESCLKLFMTASKGVKGRMYRLFGLTIFSWAYTLVEVWAWKDPDALIKAFSRSFVLNDMRELFKSRDEVRNYVLTLPPFITRGTSLVPLRIMGTDSDFEIYLKLITFTIHGRIETDTDPFTFDPKNADNMRSFVFSLCPNTGPTLRSDESLLEADLGSLINRCSLYIVLYICAPEGCKPRLSQIESLADMSLSHLEVWRILLSTWTRLALYRTTVAPDMNELHQLSEWMTNMVNLAVAKHHLAYNEVVAQVNVSEDDLSENAKLVIQQNQASVDQFLVEALKVWRKAVSDTGSELEAQFLLRKDWFLEIMKLCLGSSGLDDNVTVLVLGVVEAYLEKIKILTDLSLGVPMQLILRKIISDRLEMTRAQSDDFVEALIRCWFKVASSLVGAERKTWDEYLDPHGSDSWEILADNELSKTWKVRFVAHLIANNPEYYKTARVDLLKYWIETLTRPIKLFKYEHVLTSVILRQQHQADFILLDGLEDILAFTDHTREVSLVDLMSQRVSVIMRLISQLSRLMNSILPTDRISYITGEVRQLFWALTNSLKATWRSLQGNQDEQDAYTEMIYVFLEEIELWSGDLVSGCPLSIDTWFTSGHQFPSKPAGFLRTFRLIPWKPVRVLNPELITTFRRRCEHAAAGVPNKQGELAIDLARALSNSDPDTSYDVVLQIQFIQHVLSAYVELAFNERGGHILAVPVLVALTDLMRKCPTRLDILDAKTMCLYAKAILTLLFRAYRCFKRCRPSILMDSISLRFVFGKMVGFLQVALLQFEQIARILPVDEILQFENLVKGYGEHFYMYIYSALVEDEVSTEWEISDPPQGLFEGIDEFCDFISVPEAERTACEFSWKNLSLSFVENWRPLPSPPYGWAVNKMANCVTVIDSRLPAEMDIQLMQDACKEFLRSTSKYITGEEYELGMATILSM